MRVTRRAVRRGDLQTRRTRGLVIIPEDSHDLTPSQLVVAMIRHARTRRNCGVHLVQTIYNDITIIVSVSSDLELILRDYYRAFCGHRRIKIVGPYPEPEILGMEGYSKTQLAQPGIWNTLCP